MSENKNNKYSSGALTLRLILGIFSILISVIVGFQSCAANFGEALTDSDTSGGAAGMILGFIMLFAGIVTLAARKSKGGTIVSIVSYILGGLLTATNLGGIYGDLIIWTVLAFIFAFLLIISLFMKNKDYNPSSEE